MWTEEEVQNAANSMFFSFAKQHLEGDARALLGCFFRFLAARTDFFVGQPPAESRAIVLAAYEKIVAEHQEIHRREREMQAEKERRAEALRLKQAEMERKREAERKRAEQEPVVQKTVGELPKEEKDEPEGENPEKDAEAKKRQQEEDEAERHKLVPNAGNGADLPAYSWTQEADVVEVRVPLRADFRVRSGDVVVRIERRALRVGLRNQPPLLDGELSADVQATHEMTLWTLESNATVVVQLQKKEAGRLWSRLLVGDPEVSTRRMEQPPIEFSSMEDEEKAVVEKLVYDQRQKQAGLPTSDEQKKMRIVEKIRKINPDLNIDPAQLRLPGEQNGGFSFQSHC
ncbi:Nuclear migration protein nudC [Aphelenchoides fujianensis]|nr:Nuclear migration protein nudC [Aphelenchoides fujianensis]